MQNSQKTAKELREERLKVQLRANLKRRKTPKIQDETPPPQRP